MRFIAAIDNLIASNISFAIASLFLFAIWLYLRSRFLGKLTNLKLATGQILNVLEGLLWVFAILSVLNLLKALSSNFYSSDLQSDLDFGAYLLVSLVISMMIARAIELFWLSRNDFVDENYIPGLPRILLYGAALLLGVVLFGINHGLSINGLYISTGAIAALVAFAMQRTLGDLFSGISLSVERPFKIGDWIELEDGTQGEVRDLNWRATRLRTWDNSSLIVPNGKLAAQSFKNLHGKNHRYSPWYTVTLPADVDPRFAKALLLEVALNCKRVLKDPLPIVRLVDSGTVPYKYMVWLHYPNYPGMFAAREEFFRDLHYALKQAGIETAPPAQDVRLFRSEKNSVTLPSVKHALLGLDFTSLFNEEEMEKLVTLSNTVFFDAGSTILLEGDIAPSIYIVLNGVVETSLKDSKGKIRLLSPLSSGDYFGLASMLTDAPYFQTCVASTDVTLVEIDRKCFRDIASKREELLKGFAEVVDRRINRAEMLRHGRDDHSATGRFRHILKRIEVFVGREK